MMLKPNRVIAVIIVMFIVWWGYLTTNLPKTTMVGEPGPKFFPFVLLGILFILSVMLFFSKDKQREPQTIESSDLPDSEEPNSFPLSSELKLFAAFFLTILLIYCFGFNIGMILGVTIILWMIGWKIPRALLFSGIMTLIVYFLFDSLMKITLPVGVLL